MGRLTPPMPTLSEAESKALLARHGIPVPAEELVDSPEEAAAAAERIGYPVVAKLCGRAIAHKTERGLVKLNLGDAATVEAALPADVGRLLPSGEALIEIGAVRRLAAGQVPDGWDADFDAMVGYAKSKGWLDERGEAIQAHIEWAG